MKIRIRSKHNGTLTVTDEMGRPLDGVAEIRMTAKPGEQPIVSIDIKAPEVVFEADAPELPVEAPKEQPVKKDAKK